MIENNKPSAFSIAFIWTILTFFIAFLFKNYSLPEKQIITEQTSEYLIENKKLIVMANPSGHFIIPGKINGNNVNFLLDTGATSVSVPDTIAQRALMPKLDYITAVTANGSVQAYISNIEDLNIGPFHFYNISSTVMPDMHDNLCLLGMNILKNLDITIQDNTLILST